MTSAITEMKSMTDMTDAPEPTAATRGSRPVEPLIFEKSVPGQRAVDLPPLDVAQTAIPDGLRGDAPRLPEIGQHDLMAHYTHLSDRNFSLDGNFYPLGSCTMKHNPRINEWAAALPGFAGLHPLQDDDMIQGALRLLYETRSFLEEIAGLDEVSLQPAAGAHGEYTALKIIRAYFKDHGQPQRTIVLAMDNAHGTNPASCAMCGAGVVNVRTVDGCADLEDLRRVIEEQGAGEHRRAHDHEPEHGGHLRLEHRRYRRHRARRGRQALRRRGQLQRDARPNPPRRLRRRRDALQHAQDVLDATRLRRARARVRSP